MVISTVVKNKAGRGRTGGVRRRLLSYVGGSNTSLSAQWLKGEGGKTHDSPGKGHLVQRE